MMTLDTLLGAAPARVNVPRGVRPGFMSVVVLMLPVSTRRRVSEAGRVSGLTPCVLGVPLRAFCACHSDASASGFFTVIARTPCEPRQGNPRVPSREGRGIQTLADALHARAAIRRQARCSPDGVPTWEM